MSFFFLLKINIRIININKSNRTMSSSIVLTEVVKVFIAATGEIEKKASRGQNLSVTIVI